MSGPAEMVLEYHHDMDRWFVGRIEGGKYVDYSIHHEVGDEVLRSEIRGSWPKQEANQGVCDAILGAFVGDDTPLVWVRGKCFCVDGFSGFFCGYDLSRFLLVEFDAGSAGPTDWWSQDHIRRQERDASSDTPF